MSMLRLIRWKINWKSKKVILASAIAAAAIILGAYLILAKVNRLENYYDDRLEKISAVLQSLPESFELSGDTEKDLNIYYEKLDTISKACKQIEDRSAGSPANTRGNNIRSAVEGSNNLCKDLTRVAAYSRSLHNALSNYLAIEPSRWTVADTDESRSQLSQIRSSINFTLAELKKVSTYGLSDPAIGEITVQVESADKLAAQAQEALNRQDLAAANVPASQLIRDINQDKIEFLHARSYFWHNTVQLDDLLQSVAKLRDEFKQES